MEHPSHQATLELTVIEANGMHTRPTLHLNRAVKEIFPFHQYDLKLIYNGVEADPSCFYGIHCLIPCDGRARITITPKGTTKITQDILKRFCIALIGKGMTAKIADGNDQ